MSEAINIGAILLVAALVIVSVAFVLVPFVRSSTMVSKPKTLRRSQQLLKKRDLFQALRDLDDDMHTGKIEAHDYLIIREKLMAAGAQVMRDLEHETHIEEDHDREPEKQAPSYSQFCSHCSSEVNRNDRFCPKCGKAL